MHAIDRIMMAHISAGSRHSSQSTIATHGAPPLGSSPLLLEILRAGPSIVRLSLLGALAILVFSPLLGPFGGTEMGMAGEKGPLQRKGRFSRNR